MHLDLFLRGKVEFVNLWESHVQAQYFKFRRINLETLKEENKIVQLGLRKGIFGSYELVFPKEALAEVLAMLGAYNATCSYTKPNSLYYKIGREIIRKIFGDKKIPKKIWKEVETLRSKTSMIIDGRERAMSDCRTPGTTVHVIGIKEDSFGTIDNLYYHELL